LAVSYFDLSRQHLPALTGVPEGNDVLSPTATGRLWEIGDIVDVLEAWEAVH